MIRVGLTTSVIQRGKTGIAQWLFALTKALAGHREAIELHLFVLEEDLPLFQYAQDYCHLHSVDEHHRPPAKDILWHQLQLPKLAKQLKLDVLHVPSYRRLLRSAPCATVGTIHDLAPFRVTGKYDWKRMLYGKYIVPNLARRMTRLTAVSEFTAKDITRFFGIERGKISVIFNGLDHDRFQPSRDAEAEAALRKKYDVSEPFFLYVARIEHPGKNHIRLVEAYNRMKQQTGSNWQLVFGGSDWHGAETVHKAIQESPYRDHIRVTGFVPDEELPHLYRAAETFVYPSLFEGFGMPPVEAMACGCPVVSSPGGALEEVVGDGGILIDPEDVTSIEQALIQTANEPEKRSQLQTLGFQNAQRFRWDKAAASMVGEYQRTLEEHGTPS